ncbi:MAG: aromatic amino acid transport family protein [Chlamydiales bacterium]
MITKNNRMMGAIFLVAGTTIGAGMLALPITTGLAGFVPSLVIMTLIWLFMMLTAFYLLEVNLSLKGESNLISMAHQTLGKPGEILAWMTYLLLLYSLTAAYMVGCSQIISTLFQESFFIELPHYIWPVAIFCIFGIFLYFGTEVVDILNRILMAVLMITYLGLISFGWKYIDLKMLNHINWNFLLPSISVLVTTFGYHIILPTLTTYLEHDSKRLKWSIFIGSLIAFIVYLIWQFLVMGLIPVEGENGLLGAAQKEMPVSLLLELVVHHPFFSLFVHAFAFFAIITSLLGVGLSLLDFLADGLKIKKTHIGKLCLILLTFVPPLLFTFFYPQGFIAALNYAGFFVIILLGILPILMAWFQRYRNDEKFLEFKFKVFGGKKLLTVTIFLAIFLLSVEIFS